MVRKERDNRFGIIVDVEHPGTNRRQRRAAGQNNNPSSIKRNARREEEARLAAEQEALDNAEESVVE